MNEVSEKILKCGTPMKGIHTTVFNLSFFIEMQYNDNFSSDNVNVPCRFMYSCGNIAATCLIIEGSRG